MQIFSELGKCAKSILQNYVIFIVILLKSYGASFKITLQHSDIIGAVFGDARFGSYVRERVIGSE